MMKIVFFFLLCKCKEFFDVIVSLLMLVNDGLSWLISFGVQFFFWRELNYYDDRVGYYVIIGYVNGKVVSLLFSELKYYVQI